VTPPPSTGHPSAAPRGKKRKKKTTKKTRRRKEKREGVPEVGVKKRKEGKKKVRISSAVTTINHGKGKEDQSLNGMNETTD
jgi:hypothetical protein